MNIPEVMLDPFNAMPIIYQRHDQRTFWGAVGRRYRTDNARTRRTHEYHWIETPVLYGRRLL